MIFRQWKQVLDGMKTQTRRLVQKGELLKVNNPPYSNWPFPPTVLKNWRQKWIVGKTYAVQPGRGKKAVGRIRIIKIRQERLQSISEKDVIAEGLQPGKSEWNTICSTYIRAFRLLWNSIYTKKGARWEDNPKVWVLEFEVVNENTT